MKRTLWISFTLVMVIALVGCGSGNNGTAPDTTTPGETPSPGTTAPGATTDVDVEKLYAQSCSGCHGVNLEGGMGPTLTTIGSTLSKDEISNIIQNGVRTMPPTALKGEDAEAVAEWLANMK